MELKIMEGLKRHNKVICIREENSNRNFKII